MNRYLSIILMNRLKDLPYITKPGGLVQTILKGVNNGSERLPVKRIPASMIHMPKPGCELVTSPNLHYIPETKEKGIFYFEDNGVSFDLGRPTPALNYYRSRLRLVVWLNQRLISDQFDVTLSARVMNEMISLLTPNVNMSSEVLKNIHVEVSDIPAQSSEIFNRYDYDEKESQYLMAPYDFFAVDLDVSFGIPKNCPVPVVPIPNTPKC